MKWTGLENQDNYSGFNDFSVPKVSLHMDALHKSLRGLTHPLTLLSIALLLLNDHYLKSAYPSWFTGKLSDFAGLFFFPFLLAVALQLVLSWTHWTPRRIGALSFGLTGVWFILLKTTPWGNALTVNLLAHLLGHPVQLVLDPTDLIALVVLIPAWWVWNQPELKIFDSRPRLAQWLVLTLAAFASIATSPAPLPPSVTRLMVSNGTLYAGLEFQEYGALTGTARSDDAGKTWRFIETVPSLEQRMPLPVVACDPQAAQICYRTGEQQVEQSDDAGRTWHVAWSVPPGRRDYMERVESAVGGLFGLSKQIEMGPYDLTFVEQNEQSILVVAMGNEGILRHTSDGTWERAAVLNAAPTPFATTNIFVALFQLQPENDVWLLAGLLTLLSTCLWSTRIIRERIEKTPHARPALWWTGFLLVMVIIGLSVGYLGWLGYGLGRVSFFREALYFASLCRWLPAIPPLLVLLLVIFRWQSVARLAPQPRHVWLVAGWNLLIALGVFPLGWLPLLLWALGLIPFYFVALPLSLAITLGVLVGGLRKLRRLSVNIAAPPVTNGLSTSNADAD